MEAAAPPPAPAPAPRRVDVGRVLSETFSTYASHAGVLIGSAVVLFGAAGIINAFLQDAGGLFLILLANIISLLASAIYTGMVVGVVREVKQGRASNATVGDLFSAVTPVLGILVINGLLKSIAVGIGLLLLIIPGLFLATIWAVTAPAIVVERASIMDAFGRSWELVRDDFWPVLGAFVLAYLIVIAGGIIAAAIGVALGIAGLIILLIAFSILTAPILALVSSILFFDLGGGQTAPAAPAAPAQPPPPPAT